MEFPGSGALSSTAASNLLSPPNTTSPHTPRASSTPRAKIGKTASDVLAAFSPRPQPPKLVGLPMSPPKVEITMSKRRELRQKEKILYTISDDSDGAVSPSVVSSAFSTPQNPRWAYNIIDLEDDEDEELQVTERPGTPPPRLSTAGHSLRQPKDLHLSLRAQENGDKPVLKRKRPSATRSKQQKPRLISDAPKVANIVRTARNDTRDFIAKETTVKRARFFVAKKDYFLPLLPEHNHVKKLVEDAQQHQAFNVQQVPIASYESLKAQPKG